MRFSPTNDPFDSDEDSLSVAYRYIDSLMVEDGKFEVENRNVASINF